MPTKIDVTKYQGGGILQGDTPPAYKLEVNIVEKGRNITVERYAWAGERFEKDVRNILRESFFKDSIVEMSVGLGVYDIDPSRLAKLAREHNLGKTN